MRQVWAYTSSAGTAEYGLFMGFSDFGGTDVTYRFHRLGPDGLPITFSNGGIRMDSVSGSSLKKANRVGAVNDGAAWSPQKREEA